MKLASPSKRRPMVFSRTTKRCAPRSVPARIVVLNERGQALPIRQFLLTNLVRDPDSKLLKFRIPVHILGAALDKMGDFPFKDPASVRFDGPSLFIRGTLSHYVPDEMLPVIGQFFPRFELKDIPCGHWVISEQPDAFKRGNTPQTH